MPQATFSECPKCGAKVRKEKLRRHISGVHGASAKALEPAETAPARPVSTVSFPWRTLLVMGVIALIVIAGYWYITLPRGVPSSTPPVVAVMETNYGTIKITLDPIRAPKTAGNFIALADAGKYNGNSFHRIAAGFVIQGGAVPGAANVAWELTSYTNSAYSVAMARSGDANNASYRDTATSQFFINLGKNPGLDQFAYPYVVFGHVEDSASQAVVRAIGLLYPPNQTTYDGAPTSPVTIIRVTITR